MMPKAPYHSIYLGAPYLHALLDEVEIEHQVEGRDGHNDEAEADADGAGAVDGRELDAEEAQHHFEPGRRP